MTSQSRQAILKAHGLLYAPQQRQAEFWQRYNVERKQRWRAERLGDIALSVLERTAHVDAGKLRRLEEAWCRVIPREFIGHCRVSGFERGSLLVTVDSTTTRYVLGRQMVRSILSSLNQELESGSTNKGRRTVRWIECRVGDVVNEDEDHPPVISPR